MIYNRTVVLLTVTWHICTTRL